MGQKIKILPPAGKMGKSVLLIDELMKTMESHVKKMVVSDVGGVKEYAINNMENMFTPLEISKTDPLILVLVEDRLLKNEYTKTGTLLGQPVTQTFPLEDISEKLKRFRTDLDIDGFKPRFIKASLYRGSLHVDGSIVLALRDFFKEVKAKYNNFQGVIFVGSFPDAMILRTWLWLKWIGKSNGPGGIRPSSSGPIKLGVPPQEFNNVYSIETHTEKIAGKADIVLADLTGNWDKVYQKGPMEFKNFWAVASDPSALEGRWYIKDGAEIPVYDKIEANWVKEVKKSEKPYTYKDFFYLKDVEIKAVNSSKYKSAPLVLKFFVNLDAEVGANEKSITIHEKHSVTTIEFSNPVASPDIIVSRIDARHISFSPNPNILDNQNNHIIDQSGNPAKLYIDETQKDDFVFNLLNHKGCVFDRELERTLLREYFDRNHLYRSSKGKTAERRVTSIVEDGSPNIYTQRLHTALYSPLNCNKPSKGPEIISRPNIVQVVKWLKEPALIKVIDLHSGTQHTEIKYPLAKELINKYPNSTLPIGSLDTETGSPPWNWWVYNPYDPKNDDYANKFGKWWGKFLSQYDIWRYYNKLLKKFPGSSSNKPPVLSIALRDWELWPTLEFRSNINHININVMRTLWEYNKVINPSGVFYFFWGCDGATPASDLTLPYSDEYYGIGQISECYLFYAKGLTVFTRSKSFFDDLFDYPIQHTLIDGRPIGELWRSYFYAVKLDQKFTGAKLSNQEGTDETINRKQSYWWVINGDWTLRLHWSNKAEIPCEPDYKELISKSK